MSARVAISSYAAAGGALEGVLPAARVQELPPPVAHPRKARLPGLALALTRRALEGHEPDESAGVFFGTAYGCLSETAAFLENWVEREGAAPMPRAFTASVHNAVASSVARALRARGECRTFVQGDVSIAQALFSAARGAANGLQGELIVGAVDEWTPYVARAHASCQPERAVEPSEGGAVFRCHLGAAPPEALAWLDGVALGRPRDARAWLDQHHAMAPVDAWLVPDRSLASGLDAPTFEYAALVGTHPSAPASALALGAGWLAGELTSDALARPARPRRLGVLAATRYGDLALVRLEAAR